MLLVHLPDGPTAHFKISNLKLGRDIKVRGCRVCLVRFGLVWAAKHADPSFIYAPNPNHASHPNRPPTDPKPSPTDPNRPRATAARPPTAPS
jgi:hypothetical protein